MIIRSIRVSSTLMHL